MAVSSGVLVAHRVGCDRRSAASTGWVTEGTELGYVPIAFYSEGFVGPVARSVAGKDVVSPPSLSIAAWTLPLPVVPGGDP